MILAPALAPTDSPKWMIWTGRVLSALPLLLLLLAGAMAFKGGPQVVEGMKKFGYGENLIRLVATLELLAAVLYAIPRTAVFGAIFMTAFLGGAVATHVRIGDPGYPLAVVTATFAWLGLYLREPRLRALVPFRR